MSSDKRDASIVCIMNHCEDEPSMPNSSDIEIRIPRMISNTSSMLKGVHTSDVVSGGVDSAGDITISSYTVRTEEDMRSTGVFLQTTTEAPTSSLSLGQVIETNTTDKYGLQSIIRRPTKTLNTSAAQYSSLVTRNTLNLPQLLSLESIFSNSAHPHTGDTTSLAKPTLDPASVRWCPPDQWVPDAHVVNCMAPDCKMSFSIFTHKEHCKLCGRVFCSSCCTNEVGVLKDGSPCPSHSRNASENMKGSDPLASNGFHHPRNHSYVLSEIDGTLPMVFTHSTQFASTGSMNCIAAHASVCNAASISTNLEPTSSCAVIGDNAGPLSTSLPKTSKVVIYRVCNECFYETQLVISTRGEDGRLRRKCRGQMKLFQRVLLVNILSFLPLRDLLETALISSEFYFMSRENVIWYQYNTARWLKETENPHFSFTGDTNHMLTVAAANSGSLASRNQYWLSAHDSYYRVASSPSSSTLTIALDGGTASVVEGSVNYPRVPVLEDATALTQGEAFKRVISHHARYNYTQFLDFARRQEMARCEGLAWFSVASRVLLSSPIRVALIGPSGVGKTTSLRAFLKENKQGSTVHSTMGFTRYKVTLWMSSESKVGVNMEIYDLSGNERYEALRRFICSQCHVIGLCYNPCRKVTLVQAADVMMGVEPTLGPQPVVVCGLIPSAESYMAGVNSTSPKDVCNGFNATLQNLHVSQTPHQKRSTTLPTVSSSTPGTALSETYAGFQGSTIALATLSGDAASAPLRSIHSVHDATKCGLEDVPSLQSERPTLHKNNFSVEVSEEDAAGITVRDGGSLHCLIHQTHAFYDRLVYSLIDRLSLAVMANRTSIADLTEYSEESEPCRFGGAPVSDLSRSFAKRDPKVDKAIAEGLLRLTMQPSTLNVLLDR
ncbi:unnamed protein product [Phytomonas sp. Hart1]|nr:unnamed protein product [Phytomonas sp. Hart1]|eukprot:CCW67867.1 unnamed protein product [Phytomonas sp. isolate Hart1]